MRPKKDGSAEQLRRAPCSRCSALSPTRIRRTGPPRCPYRGRTTTSEGGEGNGSMTAEAPAGERESWGLPPTPSVTNAISEKATGRKCYRTAPSASVTARTDVFPNPGDGKPAAGRHRMTLTLRSPPSSEGTTYFSGCNRQGGRRTMTVGGGPKEFTSLSYGSTPPGTW